MTKRIYAVLVNTLRETMRDRILLAAVAIALALIAFTLFIGSISLGETERMIIDFGLLAIFLLQVFISVFIGSMLMQKDIERRIVFLLLPKPLRREEIIIGKFLGLLSTVFFVTVFSAAALFAIFLFKGMSSAILPVGVAMAISFLETAILILASMLFSTFMSPTLAAGSSVAIFLIGHSSGIIRSLMERSDALYSDVLLGAAYYLFPNLEKFNVRDLAVYRELPGLSEVALACVYALFYATFLFLLVRAAFRAREF